MGDDVLDEALNSLQVGFAQVLDLLGQVLDVEAVVALKVRAQRLCLLLGPGVESPRRRSAALVAMHASQQHRERLFDSA